MTVPRQSEDRAAPAGGRRGLRALVRRFGPAAALLAVGLAAWWSGLLGHISLADLARHQAALQDAVARWPVAAVGGYFVVFAILTAACLPVALVLTLVGGVAFGPWVGAAATALGGTAGATITYFAARSAMAAPFRRHAHKDARLHRILEGFGKDAFAYVLAMRLFPFFPFSLVNIAAGLAAAPARAYVLATLAGAVPTSLIYSSLGAGLGHTLAESAHPSLSMIARPGLVWPLVGLAALSVAMPLGRRWLRRRTA